MSPFWSYLRESVHNRVWNWRQGRELLSADVVFSSQPMLYYRWAQKPGYHLFGGRWLFAPLLETMGFALKIIEQEVNVILQIGNTKSSNRTVKILAKSQPGSTVLLNCDWYRISADSVVGDLMPVWNWQRIAPVITFDLNTYHSTVWKKPICLCGQKI